MSVPIIYFRSSSFNTWRFCPQQYYIEYVLGYRGKGNKAADKGTIAHKVLEVCAMCKQALDQGLDKIDVENIGIVETNREDPEYLEDIISRVYGYYTPLFKDHAWTSEDLKDCSKTVWKTLKLSNGIFDPRKRDIVAAEPNFDIIINKPWSEYEYTIGSETIKGNLGIKGTIDLITNVGDNVYEIIDYKTGKHRKDWATDKVKDQETLYDDPQLRIYHYAAKQMFPNIQTFLVTIIFINAGGPFTIHFDDSDLEKTEKMLRKKFEKIKATKNPPLLRDHKPYSAWKCKLCNANNTTFSGTAVSPIIELRAGKITPYGEEMSKCEQVKFMIEQKGIDWVNENYINPGYNFGHYKSPGSVE